MDSIIIFWLVTYPVCALVCTGWFYACTVGRYPSKYASYREDMGWALVFGMVYGLGGPLGVAMAYLLTGFAEHGWRLK